MQDESSNDIELNTDPDIPNILADDYDDPPTWEESQQSSIITPAGVGVRECGISPDKLSETRGRIREILYNADLYRYKGRVSKLQGLLVEAKLPKLKIGDLCFIESVQGEPKAAEVVAFKGDAAQLLLLYDGKGISQGSWVTTTNEPARLPVGDFLLGRLISPLGEPMDGRPLDTGMAKFVNLDTDPPDPLRRPIIKHKFSTGVQAIDALLTMGAGQRMGLFAGSGVGKSTMLGMIARNSEADVNVVALIGERGREVKEFMENSLGEEGVKRSVLVCSTGDQPPLMRMKCLQAATAVAEYFRDQGKKVFLMTDTVTRAAMSGREVGLAIGEPPTMKGYPPSIFSWLQRVLERSGITDDGSITALYTVLVEGDDINDPVVDTVRGIIDGHVFLSRKIAAQNHFPAIDILGSVSRLFTEICDPEHMEAAGKMREIMSIYQDAKDLIDVGAYENGSNPRIDTAIQMMPEINKFLRQSVKDIINMDMTINELKQLMQGVQI